MEFVHVPVLARECIEALNIRPDGVYVDATTGGGGHSALIAARLGPGGRLFCIDRDSDALAAAGSGCSRLPTASPSSKAISRTSGPFWSSGA